MAKSDLVNVLANRRWLVCSRPFMHVTSSQVFTDRIYSHMEITFRTVLKRGLSEAPSRNCFSRIIRGYDAYGARLTQDNTNPLTRLLTKEWHDLLASTFDLNVTGDVSAELHHHAIGSHSGSVHNDFNPGWFQYNSDRMSLNLSNNELCQYKTGKTSKENVIPIRRMRALVCIFYLANDKWKSGDGGETGLYQKRDTPVDKPEVAIAPENNSLVAFPITPYSFHCFLKNNRKPRNSVVLWLHREYDEAIAQWGSKAVVDWQ